MVMKLFLMVFVVIVSELAVAFTAPPDFAETEEITVASWWAYDNEDYQFFYPASWTVEELMGGEVVVQSPEDESFQQSFSVTRDPRSWEMIMMVYEETAKESYPGLVKTDIVVDGYEAVRFDYPESSIVEYYVRTENGIYAILSSYRDRPEVQTMISSLRFSR